VVGEVEGPRLRKDSVDLSGDVGLLSLRVAGGLRMCGDGEEGKCEQGDGRLKD
jgi:hypothetical protein